MLDNLYKKSNCKTKTQFALFLGVTYMTLFNWEGYRKKKSKLVENYLKLIQYISDKEGMEKVRQLLQVKNKELKNE